MGDVSKGRHLPICLKVIEIAKAAIKAFYDSAIWKKQRLYILHRDNFQCQQSGCHKLATEVHHKIELNKDNINDLNITLNEDNLISLCHDCHTRITKEMKSGKDNILPKIIFDSNGFPIQC